MQRSKNVPKKLPLFILLLLGLLICHSCSKDGLNQRLVRVKIETNSDEPVRIYGIKDSGENGIVIKRNFESAFKAEKEFFSIEAWCKDENTLITIKVWVKREAQKECIGQQVSDEWKYLISKVRIFAFLDKRNTE